MKNLKNLKTFENFSSVEKIKENILSTESGSNAFGDLQENLEDIDDDDRMLVVDAIEELTNKLSGCSNQKVIFKSLSKYFKSLRNDFEFEDDGPGGV